jgi:two-component system response regulator PilR (NtrC family)
MLDVLVADDDEDVRRGVAGALITAGHHVTEARDGAEAVELIASHCFDLAICDVQMPKLDGMTLLRRLRRDARGTAVVMMTTFGDVSDVVAALRDGAIDYVTKPFDADEFAKRVVGPIEERRALRRKFDEARAQFVARSTGVTLVTLSAVMRHLADRIALVSHSDASILVTGERGTGKELVARTIHAQGPRRDGPFVLLDGALLPDVILASERGELSGENAPRDAWLREATGGTLVLDGIETLSQASQARLLRAIDAPGALARRSVRSEPLGVRLITLARVGLAAQVAAGDLLEALHYRLNGVELHVPTLKERSEDLWSLVTQLLRELQPPGRTLPVLTPAGWNALSRFAFPGNVRELRWTLEHALAMADAGPIDVSHLPAETLTPK